MSAIQHNSLIHHHSDEQRERASQNQSQLVQEGNGTHNANSATVNISFNAHMRLRAYQDQRAQLVSEMLVPEAKLLGLSTENNQLVSAASQPISVSPEAFNSFNESNIDAEKPLSHSKTNQFSENIINMLNEVESNIVQSSEPGYQYLVNMLSNYQSSVEEPLQLQEIMRKEEFYLSRRKPFMESAEFQSYSQVLSQFSNIIERQQ